MDPDANKRLNEIQIQILKQRINSMSNGSDVFQSARFRRFIQSCNELDRFLLAYGFDFLWRCAFVSWVILFIQTFS